MDDHISCFGSFIFTIGKSDANRHDVAILCRPHDHWLEHNDPLVSECRAEERTLTERI
jgi:hypothetical protein